MSYMYHPNLTPSQNYANWVAAGKPSSTFGVTYDVRGAPMDMASWDVGVMAPTSSSDFFPKPNWSPPATTNRVSVAKRSALAKTAKPSQMDCAALDALVPIAYGQPRLPGMIANALYYTLGGIARWLFWVIWCEGEIDSFTSVTLGDDTTWPEGSVVTNYTGTLTQGVDSTLANAFNAIGISGFNEACPGLAYSVIVMSSKGLTSAPTFWAIVKGRKVYDPRDGTQTLGTRSTYKWSNNPALIAADYISDVSSGAGLTPVWSTVTTCANACDATVGTGGAAEKRRIADLVIDRDAPVDSWIETVRTAASMFVTITQGQVKFIPDADGSPVASYSHASGNLMSVSGFGIASAMQKPTVIEVQYTDTSQLPWQTLSSAPAMLDGVSSGTLPYTKSVVQMPWITRATQANREAIERLNKIHLRAVAGNLLVFDEGLTAEPGDIVSVTYPDNGFSSLPVRVLDVQATDAGWTLAVEKHDVGAYSDLVQNVPTTPSTNLPSPDAPPLVTGLGVAEDVYQVQTGLYASRLRISWDDMTDVFPFVSLYWITVTQAGTVVHGPASVQRNAQEYVTPALKEGLTYVVSIAIQSSSGTVGAGASGSLENLGKLKLSPPSDVPTFSGIELGGEIRFSWGPATDYDLTGYELRYSLTSGTWDTATLIDRVAAPGVTYTTKRVPAGTWRFWIKALDSIRSSDYPFGQLSANATHFDLLVHLDSGASVVADYNFTPASISLTNFVACAEGWVSNYGDTWNAQFGSAMSGYTDPLYTYHTTTGTSVLMTEAYDFGASFDGQWIGSIDYSDLAGTATVELGLSSNGSSWTWYSTLTATVAARYARMRVTTTGVALVRSLGRAYCAVVIDIGTVAATADAAQATADAALPAAGGTLGGDIDYANNAASSVATVTFNGIIDDGTVSGGTYTVDFTAGQYHKMTMGAAVTAWSITNPSGPCVVQVEISQGASANYAMTMPTSFKWPANYLAADKALTATNGARDLMVARWNGTDYVVNLIKGIA